MASRILITRLSYAEIAFAGFQLVTAAYEDIGMEAKEREIRGLLSREDIVSRFFPDGSERKRTRLGNLLIEAFQSITAPGEYETDQREDEIRAIINALSNKNLSYQQIMSVFDPSRDGTIRSQYSQVLSQQRKARATGRSARTKPRTTPPVEAARDDAPPPHEEAAREIGFDERVIISVEALEELLDQAKKDSLQLGGNARTALSRLAERVHIYRNSTESSQPLRSPISPRGAVPTPPGYEWAWKRDGTRGLVRILPDHTKKILSTLELARESNTRDKVVLPRLIQKYPTEIFSSQWAKHASCNGKEEIVDVEGAEENNAKELCRYCPVQHACLADNLEYGVNLLDDDHSSNTQNDILQANINFVRGGKTARERREMLKKKPTEVDTLIADVRDARAYQNRILHK